MSTISAGCIITDTLNVHKDSSILKHIKNNITSPTILHQTNIQCILRVNGIVFDTSIHTLKIK